MAEKYDRLGGRLKDVVEECLEAVPPIVNPALKRDMGKHTRKKRSKHTIDSLVENPRVEWEGTVAKIPIGFNIYDGGLPTIFLMYGTKPHTPKNQYGFTKKDTRIFVTKDEQLYNDFYGSSMRRKINAKQKEIFMRAINRLMSQ